MKEAQDGGQIEIMLAELAKSKGFENPHALARESKQTYSVVLRFWEGKAVRFDRKTLAALCFTLNCQPGDIFRYINAGKRAAKKSHKTSTE